MSKERLVELIDTFCKKENVLKFNKEILDKFADYLFADGWIRLPCKVGDKLYLLEDWGYKKELKENEVGVIVIKGTNDFSKELWEDVYGGVLGTFADFGKTVFLTREEAEARLKEVYTLHEGLHIEIDNIVKEKTEESNGE